MRRLPRWLCYVFCIGETTVKLDTESLMAVCDCLANGDSMEGAAQIVGCSRRLLYNLIEHSREALAADRPVSGETTLTTEAKWTPYHFRWRGESGWFHEHVLRARSPWQIDKSLNDCTDEELAALGIEDRYLRDENGRKIPLGEEPEPDMGDIVELREAAKVVPKNPRPLGAPVEIMRADNRNDPVERVTARPPEKTAAEIERSHPRAHLSVNADLKPPTPPPYARPARIEGSGRGQQMPSEVGRMTVSTQTIPYVERIHHGALRVWDGKK